MLNKNRRIEEEKQLQKGEKKVETVKINKFKLSYITLEKQF